MASKNGKPKFQGESINVAIDSSGSGTSPTPTKSSTTTRRKSRSELKSKVINNDPTKDYHSTRYNYYGELFVANLPLWRLWTARMMLASDPIVNFSLNIRNAALMAGEVSIKAKRPEVANWVKSQWDFLWNHHRPKLVSAKKWGFAPLQIVYKANDKGLLDIKRVKDFAPEDARALELSGSRLCGMRVRGNPIYNPQALWMTYNPEFGSHYGYAVTRRQYPAWYEKWMDHGAKRLLQLRMVKDAYIGDIFWYPPHMLVELPDGTKMPWRDMLREIGENRLSGGALTLPRLLDNQGKELTGYTPPQETGGATTVYQWVDSCDENILKGADVPTEVVQAADTGSGFSGRSIPFLVLLSVCTNEFVDLVNQINEQILRPAAWLNWGGDPEYEINAVSLVESFSADISNSPMAGGSIGGGPSQAPPSQGPPQAPGNVQFEEPDGDRPLHAPPGGVTIHGVKYTGGEFIPKEVIAELSTEDRQSLRAGSIARHIKAKPELGSKPEPVPTEIDHSPGNQLTKPPKDFPKGNSIQVPEAFSPVQTENHRVSNEHPQEVFEAIASELENRLGTPDKSSLSEAKYFRTANGRGIRLATHIPVYFFEDSGVNLIPSGDYRNEDSSWSAIKFPSRRSYLSEEVGSDGKLKTVSKYSEPTWIDPAAIAEAAIEANSKLAPVDTDNYRNRKKFQSELNSFLERRYEYKEKYRSDLEAKTLKELGPELEKYGLKRGQTLSTSRSSYKISTKRDLIEALLRKKYEEIEKEPTKPEDVQFFEHNLFEDTQYEELGKHLHAPAGGITINGIFYHGGEFIPKHVQEGMTKKEKEELQTKQKANKKGYLEDEVLPLTFFKHLGGSTGASLHQTKKGIPVVKKSGASPKHIENEARANKLYAIMGVPIPNTTLVHGKEGTYMLTHNILGKSLSELSGPKYESAVEQLQEHFVADALLGNWDVIGLSKDNIIVTSAGIPYRIDNGGSLAYRAQGASKGDKWNGNLDELKSMRTTGVVGEIFKDVTEEQIEAQAKEILKKKDQLKHYNPDPIFHQRLDKLEELYGGSSKSGSKSKSGATKGLDSLSGLKLPTGAKTIGKGIYDASSIKGGMESLINSLAPNTLNSKQARTIAFLNYSGGANTKGKAPNTLLIPPGLSTSQIQALENAFKERTIVQVTQNQANHAGWVIGKNLKLAKPAQVYEMPLTAFEKETANEAAKLGKITPEVNAQIQKMPEVKKKPPQKPVYSKGFSEDYFKRPPVVSGKLKDHVQEGNRNTIEKDRKAWENEYMKQSKSKPIKSWKGASAPFRKLEVEGKLDDPELAELHKWMDQAPKYRGIVHRGLRHVTPGTEAYAAITTVGGVVHFQASACTSRDTEIPFGFGGEEMFLRIATKSGVDIGDLHGLSGEKEVMLKKDTKYRVVGVHHNVEIGGSATKVFVELEELHPEDEYTYAYQESN